MANFDIIILNQDRNLYWRKAMEQSLLLVIDVQNDFVNENTRHVLKKIDDLVKSQKYDDVVTQFINNLKRLIGQDNVINGVIE